MAGLVTSLLTIVAEIAGLNIRISIPRAGGGSEPHKTTLPAGLAGILTTRTSNTEGVITFPSAHGYSGFDDLGIFFVDTDVDATPKRRYGVAIASSNALTITVQLGLGDNLPLVNTAVIVSKATLVPDAAFDGDSIKVFVVHSTKRGSMQLLDSGNYSLGLFDIAAANEGFVWATGVGFAQPITGNPVALVKWYNGEASEAIATIVALLNT